MLYAASIAEADGVSLREVARRGIDDLKIRLALAEIRNRKAANDGIN